MPSASKNLYAANSSVYPYVLAVNWSESSISISSNTSVISASASLSSKEMSFAASTSNKFYLKLYWHDDRTNSDTHFATSSAFTSCGGSYGARSVSGSITVTHKDDGSLNGYVFVEYEAGSTSGGYAPASSSLSTANTALTTIARASDFTIDAGSALLGSPISLSISRKLSSYTHRVSYQFEGSSSTTVATSATTSVSFTPPVSLASRIPNSTYGKLVISVSTWNGSTQVGSAINKAVTLSVPTSVVPTMGTPTATRVDNGVPSGWGVYVQGYSKATISIVSAAGAQGSTIKSYSIVGPGLNTTSSYGTTSVLTSSGTNTYVCTITDSRGRSVSKTVSINVESYTKPSIAVDAYRCNSAGAANANGTYLRVTVDWTISSISTKNYVLSRSATCNGVTNTTFGDNAAFVLAANVSIGSKYVLTVTLKDALGNSDTKTVDIPTATRVLNVKANKQGLAIGKFSEKDDTFEVGWNTEINGNLSVKDDATFSKSLNIIGGLDVSQQSSFEGHATFDKGITVTNGHSSISSEGYVSSWINTRRNAIFKNETPCTSGSANSLASIKTVNGSWQIAALNDDLYFVYTSDADVDSGNSNATLVRITKSGQIVSK